MPLRLHLLRHGQTPASRANVFCGRGLDLDLTPDGAAMADAYARFHAEAARADGPGPGPGTRWQAVYASPLRRTLATAAPAAERAGLPVQPLDGLAELDYGAWDGRSAEDVDRDDHDAYVRWTADPAWNAPTGGETAAALARRAQAALEAITAAHDDGDVLVVSHKATIRVALCGLLGVDVGRFRFRFACPTASESVVEFGPHGPMAVSVADRAHLDARLRALPGT